MQHLLLNVDHFDAHASCPTTSHGVAPSHADGPASIEQGKGKGCGEGRSNKGTVISAARLGTTRRIAGNCLWRVGHDIVLSCLWCSGPCIFNHSEECVSLCLWRQLCCQGRHRRSRRAESAYVGRQRAYLGQVGGQVMGRKSPASTGSSAGSQANLVSQM